MSLRALLPCRSRFTPAAARALSSRPPTDAHDPFFRMAPPRRASAMDRLSPLDQAQVGAVPPLRPFNKGDILRPSDLAPRNLAPRVRSRPPRPVLLPAPASAVKPIDPFVQLGLSGRAQYLNGRLLSAFLSPVGRIKSRAETGLTVRSQRQVTKGIKRAQSMGLLSRWRNTDVLGERRPVARDGHGSNRDWSVVEGARVPKYEQTQ